jgi:hypothetical protein
VGSVQWRLSRCGPARHREPAAYPYMQLDLTPLWSLTPGPGLFFSESSGRGQLLRMVFQDARTTLGASDMRNQKWTRLSAGSRAGGACSPPRVWCSRYSCQAAWGAPGVNPGQFEMPYGLAVNGAGDVYLADRLHSGHGASATQSSVLSPQSSVLSPQSSQRAAGYFAIVVNRVQEFSEHTGNYVRCATCPTPPIHLLGLTPG